MQDDIIRRQETKAAVEFFDQIDQAAAAPVRPTLTVEEQLEKDQKTVRREAGRAARKLLKE